MKITISMKDEIVRKLYVYCTEYGFNRSELISLLVRKQIMAFDLAREGVEVKVPTKVEVKTQNGGVIDLSDETHDQGGKLLSGNAIDTDNFGELNKKHGWCNLMKAHSFTAGQTFDVYCVTVENIDGIPVQRGKRLLKDVWGCRECVLAEEGNIMSGDINLASK